jgi:UMF1 family MFS transporter
MIQRKDVQAIVKGDKRVVRGWVMYDWANSAYQLTIASAIFPTYYTAVTTTGTNSTVLFFGKAISNSVLYSWTIAVAYLLVALGSPLLSSIADYTGRRKGFMRAFTMIGATACGALFFFDRGHIELGVIAFGLGTLGYGGSIVYYNSFLPIIAEPEDQDRISARGYSMGYLGSVILLLINLCLILQPELFGMEKGSTLPARISFLSVCIWWIAFSQITFSRLPKYTFRKQMEITSVITNGYNELRIVFNQIRKSYKLGMYLAGFYFLMMGILTTMFMAVIYGKKQLGLTDDVLIPTVLAIQLIGVAGAWSFARISGKIGNLPALMITIVAWTIICIAASTINSASQFVTAAIFIGFIMGGSQSLARSTYSKMLPTTTTDHTSFFSFYDVNEKLATVAGTFCFGAIEALTGSMRDSVLAISVFFMISFVFIALLYRRTWIEKRRKLKMAV